MQISMTVLNVMDTVNVLKCQIFISFKNAKAKKVDPDQEQSGQGLNFLQSSSCFPN